MHSVFATFVHQPFRHQKQADTFDAVGRVWRSSKDEVDNILGQIVLAICDEDFCSEDLIAAIGLAFGPCPYQGQIAARLWLVLAYGG